MKTIYNCYHQTRKQDQILNSLYYGHDKVAAVQAFQEAKRKHQDDDQFRVVLEKKPTIGDKFVWMLAERT